MSLSGDDLRIVVGAQLSTEEAKKTLNNFVKTSSETKVVLNTEVDSRGIERIEKVYKTLNKYLNENGTLLETVTHQRELSNGKLSAENGIISRVVEGYKKMSSATKEVSTNTESLNNKYNEQVTKLTTLEKAQKKYNEQLNKTVLYDEKTRTKDQYGNIVEQNIKKFASGESIMKRVYEYEDEAGRKIQATTNFIKDQNGQWKLIGSTSIKVLDDQIKKAEQAKNEAEKYNATLKNVYKYKFNGKEVTLETKTLPSGEQIRTITREYEECGKKITEVSQQTKKLGEEWSKEHLISKNSIKDEVSELSNLENKLEEVNRFREKGVDTTKIHIIDSAGVESVKIVQKYIDDLGNEVEATTLKVKQSDGTWKTYDTTLKKTNDSIAAAEKKEAELAKAAEKETEAKRKQITLTETYKGKQQTVLNLQDKTIHKLQEESKITTNALNEKTKVVTATDKWVDAQGKLHTKISETTTKVDEYGNAVGEATTKVTENVEASVKGFSKLGQSFSQILIKVAKFYIASLPIRAMQNAITNAIQAVKDFDSALTEFKKVSDLSGDSLVKYTEQLEELGKKTARTRTEMVEIATQFRKSGFTDNKEVAELSNAAALYQNIADEELSASDAASVLISQMKAFQKEGLQAEQVIDAINETANRNAVSTSDIGRGLTQAGAALSTYGNSFYETIALVTAGTEIFQGRSQQVARGLNTVASRIAKNEKALQEYGVEIYDANGNLKSTYDILSELSPKWDEMSKAEQVALGTTLAGVNQYKVFSAVMTNFDTAVKVTTQDINNFNGSALRENERYMESIKAKLQAVKTELQEMILKSNLEKIIKDFLKLAETALKVQNYIGGLKPLLTAISGILITFNLEKILLNISKIKKILSTDFLTKLLTSLVDVQIAIGKIASGQKVYIKDLEGSTVATNSATVATEGYGLALSSLQTVIGLVTIAITGLIIGINAYNSAQENRVRKAHEAVENAKEQINKVSELSDKINNEILTREALNDIVQENLKKYSDEFSQINDLNEIRERAIELLDQEKKKEAEKLQASSGTTYEKEKEKLENLEFGKKFGGKTIDRKARGVAQSYKKNINPNGTAEDLLNYITEQRLAQMEGTVDFSSYATLFGFSSPDEAEEVFNYIENEYKELSENVDNYAESLRKLGYATENGALISLEDAMTIGNEDYGKASDEVQKIYSEIANVKKQYNLTNDEAEKVKENLKKYNYDVQKTVEGIFPDIVSSFKEEEEEFAALIEQFNLTEEQQQKISEAVANGDYEDKFSALAGLYPDLADGVNTYTDALKEEAEETERAEALLTELGIKENALQKEIGMSSVELIRQADAWGINETALYGYLKALKQFDESVDNTQNAYSTLSAAVEEYNSMEGYSIDTMQALLKLSPEYLLMLDDEINGRKSLKDSITDKIKAQALEAKQEIYNMAVERLQKLTTEENTEANKENAKVFQDSVPDIDAQTGALKENSLAYLQNTLVKDAADKGRGAEAEQIMKDMQAQIDIIDKAMLSLGTDFSSAMGSGTKATKGANSALKEQNNLLKEQKQLLEEKKKQYDTVVSYIKKKIQDEIKKIENEKKAQVDAIKEQIDALQDLKDAESDAIDEQIDKLKEQKEIEQTYWEEKIEAFKKQNEQLEEQLEYEKLLENLAKAKSKRVRVYKEGQGFVYTEDGNEVDKAQAEIDEYTRKKQYEDQLELLQSYKEKSEKNYEEQIKALEKLKDEKEKNYEEQIKALEKHQEEIEAAYDAQIAYFQGYLDKFTEQTDAYENETNRQLAIQLTGIDFEQQGWQKRLDNLADFVQKYNALLGDIHTLDAGGTVDTTTTTTTQDSPQKTPPQTPQVNKVEQARQNVINNIGGGSASATADWYAKNYGGKKASGDSSIDKDGFYLVGDDPNKELVIGSKLNGSLMSLSEGSGVVNATSTRTLAGVLNQLGLAGNQGINMSNSQNKSTNIQIGNISLPSVQNGKDFVDYLQNFSLQMTQEAFA